MVVFFRKYFDVIILSFVSLILFKFAIRNPLVPWDTLAYHLPFGGKVLGLNKFQDLGFVTPYYENWLFQRFDGFPMFPYVLQAIIFKFTKVLDQLVLISFIPYVLLIGLIHKVSNKKSWVFILFSLSCPLIAIHVHSSYIDLLIGVIVAMLFVITTMIEDDLNSSGKISVGSFLGFFSLSIMCGQTKFLAIPFQYLFAVYLLVVIIRLPTKPKEFKLLISFFILAIIASSCKLIINMYLFKNPFYPVANAIFWGPEAEYVSNLEYFNFLSFLKRPFYFLSSVTEIDWLIRGVDFGYTIDQGQAIVSKRFGSARTGGFGFLSVIVFLLIQIPFFFSRLPRSHKTIRSLKLFFILLFMNSFMPQSFELRYWLHIPLIAAFIINDQFLQFPKKIRILSVVLILCALIVQNRFMMGTSSLWKKPKHPFKISRVLELESLNPKNVCTGRGIPFPMLYSTVINKGGWKTNINCDRNNLSGCTLFIESEAGVLSIEKANCGSFN